MPNKIENGQSGTPVPTNLTDSEIVKILRFLAEYYKDEAINIKVSDVLLGAYDLINRLCSENKSMQNYIDFVEAEKESITEKFNCQQIVYADLTKIIQGKNAEVKRLKKENTILSQNADTAFQDGLNEAQDLYAEQIKSEIKAEAYKEFAERLEKEFTQLERKQRQLSDYDGACATNLCELKLKNILNKLVGETDA